MARARIVELAAAASFSGLAGVVAFLTIPLDAPGRTLRAAPPSAAAIVRTEGAPPAPPPAALPRPVEPTEPPKPEAASAPDGGRALRLDDALLRAMDAGGGASAYVHHGPPRLRLHLLGDRSEPAEALLRRLADRVEQAEAQGRPFGELGDPELLRDTLFALGAQAQSVGELARAAAYYEAVAEHFPSARGAAPDPGGDEPREAADAPAALENAILFREALGQIDAALAGANLYASLYGETRVSDAARVGEHAADLRSRRAEPMAALAAQRRHVVLARHASRGAAVRAEVLLGRTLWRAGRRQGAVRAFRRALRAWADGGADEVAASPDDPAQPHGADFARTLEAVAEAGFYLAELRHERFRAVRAPVYQGDGSERDVAWWVARALRPFVARKLRELTRAREAYARVAALGVTEWQIAALGRTGELYGALAEELRRAPLPRVVRGSGELAVATEPDRHALSGPAARLAGPAIASYERCLSVALQSRHYGEWAARCGDALARLAPERHPAARERGPMEPRIASEPVLDPSPGQRGPAGAAEGGGAPGPGLADGPGPSV